MNKKKVYFRAKLEKNEIIFQPKKKNIFFTKKLICMINLFLIYLICIEYFDSTDDTLRAAVKISPSLVIRTRISREQMRENK
jgi:hypothetical protein